MSREPPLEVKVGGPWALFTRPEFSAERVSYEVMTPSAARGILEQIFWKPEMSWRVREIHVLNPIRHFSILRNEINSLQSDRSARGWAKDGVGNYYADGDRERAQRHSLCLRDVSYLIRADIVLRPHATAHVAKYRDQFRRRVERGRCFTRPYLGTREFAARFGPADGSEIAIDRTDDLGLMLLDVDFAPDEAGSVTYLLHDENGARAVKGNARPAFFRARLERGVLRVPDRHEAAS